MIEPGVPIRTRVMPAGQPELEPAIRSLGKK
jgi:hypothetical protein